MKIKTQFICALAILVFLACFGFVSKVAAATTYYVSLSGSDSNPGTQSAPFRHVSKGVAAATNAGDTVIVMDGFYDNEGVVSSWAAPSYVVTLTHSGTANNPITIRAQDRGQVTLDAGNNTTGTACNGAFAYFDLANAAYVVIQGFNIQNGCALEIHSNNNAHDITLRNNEFHNTVNHSVPDSSNVMAGIYINANNYNFTFDGNVFHDIYNTNDLGNSYVHFIYAHAANTTIVNNIFYHSLAGWDIQTASGFSGLIANNTFYGPNGYRGGTYKQGEIELWDAQGNVTIRNNIFYQPYSSAVDGYLFSSSGCSIDNNIIFGSNLTATSNSAATCSTSSNRFNTDPQLNNPTGFDFHPLPGSPAIDTGVAVSQATADFDGNNRPQGSGYDVGAYEFTTSFVSSAPVLNLSPSGLSFGSITLGATSTAQFLTLTNTGTATLNLTLITFSGDYSPAGLGTCGVSSPVPAGGNCTISVQFTPTVLGSRAGSVTISDNAAGSPHTALLNGTGVLPAGCLASSLLSWQGLSFSSQSGQFQATFDATPGGNLINALTGLSPLLATDYTSLAAIVRFNPSGFIDARNGGVYQAGTSIPYLAGNTYHFRLVINVINHTYSAYVTAPSSTEQAIGTNYAFRTEQATASALGFWDVEADSGTHTVCNFTVTPILATQKFPRQIKLSSLEGMSTIPAGTAMTAQILGTATSSVLETQNNLLPDSSGNYTVTFLSSDPQTVNIRVVVTGYLSSNLANVDTTVNSTSALSVPQLAAGDLNADDVVNSLDYSVLNSHYLQNYPAADINKDSLVNSLDFAVLKNNFNKSGQ